MQNTSKSFFGRNRILLLVVGAIALLGAWYAFRPEKLFINERVNEAAPFPDSGPKTVSTGRFQGKLHATTGRATIFRKQDGTQYLRLTDFSTSNGLALHVLLVDGKAAKADQDFSLDQVESVDLGPLKGNQGDQTYDLPKGVDPAKLSTASIYCQRFRANFGIAKLEPF